MQTYFFWAIAVAFVIAVYVSDRIRGVTHEIWDRYFLSILRLGWPYALIFAVYDIISTGSLARTIHAIISGF